MNCPPQSNKLPGVKQLILVALGGALGAVLRWKIGGAVLHHTESWRFPFSTFVVNVVGCLVAGVLAGLTIKLDWFSADARTFLFTGLLGGFTTFSAFGVETLYLLRRHEYAISFSYVVASVVCGIGGLVLVFAIVPGRTPSS
jgi:CrcB protein